MAFTDDVKNLLNEAVVGKVKGWLDSGRAQVLYKYQNLKADDIYAELKNLVDEEALNYLQKEFYNAEVDTHSNSFKLLEDTADCIKAAQEALGKNLNLDEVTYVNEEWGRRFPESAKTKQQLKESIVNYIRNGKIYVKRRLVDKCKSIRSNMLTSKLRRRGNMGVAEVNIPGLKNEFIAHSKINFISDKGADKAGFSFLKSEEERKLTSYVVVNNYSREIDSEAKILEDIASQISDLNIQGTIDLYSERPCCQSCTNLILEFWKMFPRIVLNVYTS